MLELVLKIDLFSLGVSKWSIVFLLISKASFLLAVEFKSTLFNWKDYLRCEKCPCADWELSLDYCYYSCKSGKVYTWSSGECPNCLCMVTIEFLLYGDVNEYLPFRSGLISSSSCIEEKCFKLPILVFSFKVLSLISPCFIINVPTLSVNLTSFPPTDA